MSVLVSVTGNDGDAGMGMVTILAFFCLPNGMTWFLANIASVLDAVAVEVICVSVQYVWQESSNARPRFQR